MNVIMEKNEQIYNFYFDLHNKSQLEKVMLKTFYKIQLADYDRTIKTKKIS